jgi:hypothetical protein
LHWTNFRGRVSASSGLSRNGSSPVLHFVAAVHGATEARSVISVSPTPPASSAAAHRYAAFDSGTSHRHLHYPARAPHAHHTPSTHARRSPSRRQTPPLFFNHPCAASPSRLRSAMSSFGCEFLITQLLYLVAAGSHPPAVRCLEAWIACLDTSTSRATSSFRGLSTCFKAPISAASARCSSLMFLRLSFVRSHTQPWKEGNQVRGIRSEEKPINKNTLTKPSTLILECCFVNR